MKSWFFLKFITLTFLFYLLDIIIHATITSLKASNSYLLLFLVFLVFNFFVIFLDKATFFLLLNKILKDLVPEAPSEHIFTTIVVGSAYVGLLPLYEAHFANMRWLYTY